MQPIQPTQTGAPLTVTLYEKVGGEDVVRKLANCFYDLMDEREEFKTPLRDMHEADLTPMREKLFEFLSGWMGGPQLYIEKYGHPRLRQRHMPFKIGELERDQWMACMNQAIEEVVVDQETAKFLSDALYKVADFMRNQSPLELTSD